MTFTASDRASLDETVQAISARQVSQKLSRQIDGAVFEAERILNEAGGRKLSDTEHRRFKTLVSDAGDKATLLRSLREIESEHVQRSITVREPRTYAPGNGNSYFADLAIQWVGSGADAAEARARLDRHAKEVAFEARTGTTEGARAQLTTRSLHRDSGRSVQEREVRAMTSASGSGGAFVTPQYLTDRFALYHAPTYSFAGQCVQVPDDGYGLTFSIPAFTSTAATGQQTAEGNPVTDSSPGAALLSANLVTLVGEVEVSQALIDRAGPTGIDDAVGAQLAENLAADIDSYLWSQALANPGAVTNTAAFSAAVLFGDLGKSAAQMRTAAGAHLAPTHLFATGAWVEAFQATSDPNGRPLLVPHSDLAWSPVRSAPDGSAPAGYTGQRVLSRHVFVDDLIPANGSDAQLITARPSEVFVQVSEPAIRVIPETNAQNLQVTIQLRAYVGAIVRYPSAIQSLSGSTYAASPTFA